MTQPLFLEPEVLTARLVKEAGPTIEMPDDIRQWPVLIEQQLFKMHPYLAAYTVVVDMMDVDTDSRTAYGRIIVQAKPQQETLPDGRPSPEPREFKESPKVIQIPFIIKDGQLFPLDMFIHGGKMLPLTESRVMRALFRPSLADDIAKAPEGIKGLFPTDFLTAQYGWHMEKKLGSLIDLASAKGHVEDLQKFASVLDDPLTRQVVSRSKPVQEAISKLTSIRKTAKWYENPESLARHITPTTWAMWRTKEGDYVVKVGNADLYYPVEYRLSRKQVLKSFSKMAGVIDKVDQGEVVMSTTVSRPTDPPKQQPPQPATQFGVYKVPTELGVVQGLVFPDIFCPKTGRKKPFKVFTTGTIFSMAEEILGWPGQADSFDLPKGPPQGFGMFVIPDPSGKGLLVAYTPVTIVRTYLVHGVPYHSAHMLDGRNVEIVLSGEVKESVWTHDAWFLPISAQWVPFGKDIDLAYKAPVDHHTDTVEIRLMEEGERHYYFYGPPVDSIPERYRALSWGEALFLLGLLGIPQRNGIQILNEVTKHGRYIIYGCKTITFAEPKITQYRQKLAELRQEIDQLKRELSKEAFLVKEAALIKDPEAVDTLLALNFINEENVADFIQQIPRMENVLTKLTELLFAARMGLDQYLPPELLEKAIKSLDKVLDKLERLKYAIAKEEG